MEHDPPPTLQLSLPANSHGVVLRWVAANVCPLFFPWFYLLAPSMVFISLYFCLSSTARQQQQQQRTSCVTNLCPCASHRSCVYVAAQLRCWLAVTSVAAFFPTSGFSLLLLLAFMLLSPHFCPSNPKILCPHAEANYDKDYHSWH